MDTGYCTLMSAYLSPPQQHLTSTTTHDLHSPTSNPGLSDMYKINLYLYKINLYLCKINLYLYKMNLYLYKINLYLYKIYLYLYKINLYLY